MAHTTRQSCAAGRSWHERRIGGSLTTQIIVVAVGILDLDLCEQCTLLSRKIIVVFN